jgi:ATP synthase protein I
VTVAGLRGALVLTLVLGVGTVLAGALVSGRPAAVGAAVGVGLLVGFYLFGLVTVQVAATVAPAVSLLVALLTYTLQVVLLGLVFVALQRSGALDGPVDRRWLSGTVVIGTLLWTAALVRGAVTQRIPHYHSASDLGKSSESTPTGDHPDAPEPG